MRFRLIDAVLERSAERIVAVKQVTAAEEYLGDHFPGFPVLPGVLMIEAMVQAAREILAAEGLPRHVLGQVRAVRYGRFVRPGESLRIEVTLDKRLEDGAIQFRGSASLVGAGIGVGADAQVGAADRSRAGHAGGAAGDTAVSGRFTMRPIRTACPSAET